MIPKAFAVSASPIQINLKNVGTNIGLATDADIGLIINNAIKIVIMIALILVLAMLIFGALQWILSGGDKEKVAGARNRITHALIGLAILGLAFVILTVVSGILGIPSPLSGFEIPTLTTPMTQ